MDACHTELRRQKEGKESRGRGKERKQESKKIGIKKIKKEKWERGDEIRKGAKMWIKERRGDERKEMMQRWSKNRK